MTEVRDRSEVAERHTWDLESIFADHEAWEAAYGEVEDLVAEFREYEGRATEDAATLLETLRLKDELGRAAEQVVNYARMRRDEDTRDNDRQATWSRAQSLYAEVQSATSFVEPALQDLDREELETMLAAEPDLQEYEHYLDDVLRQAEHTRSAEVENLLAELGEVHSAPSDIYGMLSNADLEFPTVEGPDGEDVEVTTSNVTTLLKRPDREFRRAVHETFYDRWEDVRNTVASAYEASVTTDVKLAEARGYDTAREAALDGPNVPVEVYDTLVETVRDNLGTLHDHAELKADALDVDELGMHDVYMPVARDEGPDIPYEEARDHVVEAVGALGEDYQRRVQEGLDSRWVDVYETEGKRSGAYSGGGYDTQPFILMNYQDDVSSMYTLAHELGHSLHSQLTSEEQPYVYGDYEIFVAEVASTVNEVLLTHHLLDTVDDERFRRHVLDQYLEQFRGTMFRQTMFADFELRAHREVEEGGALTPDRLDEIYRDLKEEFYAPADVDDRIAREWMRIPHFYRAFYVYQYATGVSAAVAIGRDVLEEGEPAAERYRSFLRRGSRAYPLELLQEAGVDMSTSDPIERAIEEYDRRLDQAADLV
jgi:oligoendopeptidase F